MTEMSRVHEWRAGWRSNEWSTLRGKWVLKQQSPTGVWEKARFFFKKKKKKDGDRKGELERDVLTPRSKNESATGRERDTEMEVSLRDDFL